MAGALALLTLLCHAPALGVPFVGDDTRIVVENASLRPPLSLEAVVRYERFRPHTNASYALDAALGGIHAPGFHRTNLLLHVAFVLLLYALALSRGAGAGGAALAAALVGLHPFFGEGPAYVSARADVLAGIWVLVGLLAFRGWTLGGRRALLVLALGAWIAGSLAKEIAALLPLLWLLEDLWVRRGPGLRARLRTFHAPLVGLLVLGGLARVWLYFGQERGGTLADPALSVMTQVGATWRYLRLLLVPEGQTILHIYPQATTWADPGLWIRVLAVAALACAAWRLRRRAPTLAWGLAAYLLILAPTTLIPLDEKLAERRAYVPLALFLSGAVPLGWSWARRSLRLRALLPAVFVLLGLLAALTQLRYAVWQDPRALWGESVERAPQADPSLPAWTQSPLNATPFNNAGAYAYAAGDLGAAERAFTRAIAFNLRYAEAYSNRGAIYLLQGALSSAEADLRRALELQPQNVTAHANLGMLLARQQRPHEAEESFASALRLNPHSSLALAGRGRMRAELERWSEARADLSLALDLEPERGDLGLLLVTTLLELEEFAEARELIARWLTRLQDATAPADQTLRRDLEAKEIQAAGPADPDALTARYRALLARDPENRAASYALALHLAGGPQRQAALQAYAEHLRRYPSDALALRNRGRLRARLGDGPGALADLTRATELNPRDPLAWLNLGQVAEALGRDRPALVAYGHALRADPRYGLAYLRRGLLQLRRQAKAQARQDLRLALEHLPKTSRARATASEALQRLEPH